MHDTQNNYTILIVDDTPENLKVLSQMLQEQVYTVLQAPNGKFALTIAKRSKPDAVLLDIKMPDINGFEVCRRMKEDDDLRGIPVIFLSALDETEDKVKAFQCGGVDYITKPFAFEEVTARLKIHLALHRYQLEIEEKNQRLEQVLIDLKSAQDQLVLSEKMAALGQLVTSVAHEVNNPLGAIRASSSIITKSFHQAWEILPTVIRTLSPELLKDFLTLVEHSTLNQEIKGPKEKKEIHKSLKEKLSQEFPEKAESIAKRLVELRIYDEIDRFYNLFKFKNLDQTLETANCLARMQWSNHIISSAVIRASKVVYALLNCSQLYPSGEMELVNISKGIETVLTLYRNQIDQGVEIIRNYEEVPKVACYPDQLIQVWTNLINNALYAMNNKGTLIIHMSKAKNIIRIAITDSGIGVKDDLKDRIFEPFFSTKPLGEGSGLGLDITKRIIDQHKGTIDLESKPGKTTFTITLPIR